MVKTFFTVYVGQLLLKMLLTYEHNCNQYGIDFTILFLQSFEDSGVELIANFISEVFNKSHT